MFPVHRITDKSIPLVILGCFIISFNLLRDIVTDYTNTSAGGATALWSEQKQLYETENAFMRLLEIYGK